MSYETLRAIHITCAFISIAGFFLRGLLMLAHSPLLRTPWLRILPHINDTVLLTAGASLMIWSGQYPGTQQPWLAAKLAGLLLYIVLGALALRPGRRKEIRAGAFLAALLVVTWMVSVAISRQPLGILSTLTQINVSRVTSFS
jgi:uncharacterized membrane protein SirB2